MQQNPTKPININKLQQYNKSLILSQTQSTLPLNTQLCKNQFLKDQQKYHYIMYKIKQYNKRLLQKHIDDQYQSLYYHQLNSVLITLSHLANKNDQIYTLNQIYQWVKKQQTLISQRKQQGYIRYEVNKEDRLGLAAEIQPQIKDKQDSREELDQIPSQTVARLLQPFEKNWRTIHKQFDIPVRRISDYKRKIINIAPFIQPKQIQKMPLITYPKIHKVQYQKYQQNQQSNNFQQTLNALIPSSIPENFKTEQKMQDQNDQFDLGGPADEQGNPQEDEPAEQVQDKLAPKLKSFSYEYQDAKGKPGYMFYRGTDNSVQKRMQAKYLKSQNDQIKKQNEDRQKIQIIQQWAAAKSKLQKQQQKKLQNKLFNPRYSFSFEVPQKKQRLNTTQELKFGLSLNLRKPTSASQIILYQSTLPKIGQQNSYEKSIRKDRLKSLKNKFGKLLNLQQKQQIQASNSLCQYSSRKRGLSEIIRKHSKSKQRLYQLDQVTKIKQKLAGSKIGIDIKSLSMGLCVPEQVGITFEPLIPGNSLPSNPFMIETKKKKKKKK